MLKGHTLTVINAEGDHFQATSGTGEGVLSLHDDPGFVPSPYHGAWQDGESSVIIRDTEEAYRKTLSLGAPGHGQYLDVIVSVPIRALHEPGVVALRNALLLAGGFLVLTLLVAWIVGDRIARPLVDLAHAIASRERVLKPLELRHQGHGGTDEVGLLAHAFNGLTSQLIAQTAETLAIVSAAPDGIATFDAHGKILKCNRAFEDLFGAGQGALNGANLRGLLCDGDALGALIPQAGAAAESDARALYSLEGCRLDGTTFPAEVALNAVSDERETRYVAMLRDVTERREAERQLRQTVETLEATKVELVRSNEELDTFAYIASHDLRAPLRVIRNASRWLEDDLGDALDEESQENLGLLRSRVNRMDQLLTDLLEHSRVGRVQHDGSTVTGADLVENIRHLVNAPEGFTITASPELEAMEVRQLPLQTVLLNLVSNALKHHDKACGHVMIDVTRTEDGVLRFDVTDDGPGIAVEYQTRIFDMFQTLKSRDEVEGSGIGLAIVKKTVEMSGGLVSVDSAPGEGCSFSFTWPDDCGKGEAKGKGTSDDRTAAA
nr:ATP-binding protein [Sagittula salina]